MRISDWSSDVCSSDLAEDVFVALFGQLFRGGDFKTREVALGDEVDDAGDRVGAIGGHRRAGQRVDALDQRERDVVEVDSAVDVRRSEAVAVQQDDVAGRAEAAKIDVRSAAVRSEEHTAELQSLMRLSYAVFWLKKKIK